MNLRPSAWSAGRYIEHFKYGIVSHKASIVRVEPGSKKTDLFARSVL